MNNAKNLNGKVIAEHVITEPMNIYLESIPEKQEVTTGKLLFLTTQQGYGYCYYCKDEDSAHLVNLICAKLNPMEPFDWILLHQQGE